MFPPVLATSIMGRAESAGAVHYHVHDIRDWSEDRHRRVDDRPFGGGPGMVMMCQPLFDCVSAVEAMDARRARRILLTPQGEPLCQSRVEQLAAEERLLFIAGHYEGIDERVVDELSPLEISLGDYVLSGGELPVLVLVDTIVRLLPGVLGDETSAAQDSFSRRDLMMPAAGGRTARRDAGAAPTPATADRKGAGRPAGTDRPSMVRRLLDCPHYTRPRVWRDREVPSVLLSGDHAAIAGWRLAQSLERTRIRRPDLLSPDADAPSTPAGGEPMSGYVRHGAAPSSPMRGTNDAAKNAAHARPLRDRPDGTMPDEAPLTSQEGHGVP